MEVVKINTKNFKGELSTGERYFVRNYITNFGKNKVFVSAFKVEISQNMWSTRSLSSKVFGDYGVKFKEAVEASLSELSQDIKIDLIRKNQA